MNHAALFYFHRSNLLSYLSLLSGLLDIIGSRESGNLHVAGGLIAFCGLADLFDGKFANLFVRSEKQKALGVQLDSLTDCIVFGLAPVLCLYSNISNVTGLVYLLWIGVAFFYVLCAITRLGVYNIDQNNLTGFIGLPTTISGFLWSVYFLFETSGTTSAAVMLGLGIAMVSPVAISRPRQVGILMLVTWALALIYFHGASALSKM